MSKETKFKELFDKLAKQYQNKFLKREYTEENNDYDILMDLFGVTPELKRQNRQFWGRHLGKCWEGLVVDIFRTYTPEKYKSAFKVGADEPIDLIVGNYAIDTKYRVGSGDSGTLKKFKQYGHLVKEKGYTPVFLILREDNLPGAITAIKNAGWTVYTGRESLEFIEKHSGFDIEQMLVNNKGNYPIN